MQTVFYSIYFLVVLISVGRTGLADCTNAAREKNESSTLPVSQPANNAPSDNDDAIIGAFFGLDNSLPLRANALVPGAYKKDGMPVHFKDEIDANTLDAKDFVVIDSKGEQHIPIGATLRPADEEGENRTVLLIGELGTDGINPPIEVKVVGDLQTKGKHENASAPSRIRNLKGASTKTIVPLTEGPTMFFAQIVTGRLAEQKEPNTQVVQVAWQGGITPVNAKINEKDLNRFYTVYAEEGGKLSPLTPKSIGDIQDNDNYHQLLIETSLRIVKVSMSAGVVKDPNGDPNPPTQVFVEP